jgi:N-acetylglucosaminyldiphosphoundecaprenol N-acetyl-beta-D-mannosaminyltransferase
MIINFFNINFFNIHQNQFNNFIRPGLLVFPSAPGLASINDDYVYLRSLQDADIVFFDSGYFVLLLKLFKNIKVNKFSGYKFIKLFISYLKNQNSKSLFIVESDFNNAKINKLYFKRQNISVCGQYIAPIYKKKSYIEDIILIKELKKNKPKYILINLGGGIQEILGSYIKKKLKYKPIIICTGAALSFITKKQAPINDIIDKFFLGWLVRCIYNPVIFIPRYLYAFKLAKLVFVSNIKIIK